MHVKVVCPNPRCDASYSLSQLPRGRPLRCKKCGTLLPTEPGTDEPGTEGSGAEAKDRGASGSSLELPKSLGRYRLLRELGSGGMGTVYLAHDTQLDRPVALKVPVFDPLRGEEYLERFFREARSAARLRHANLCPVYDVGQVDGTYFLTMAFIEGETLDDLMKRRPGPFPEREAAEMIRTLADAVEAAHRRGIMHRDLKPANVMIDA